MTESASPAPELPVAAAAPTSAAAVAPAAASVRAPSGPPTTWLELLSMSPPDTRAAQLGSLQRTAGNRAVARLVSDAAPDPSLFSALRDFGLDELLSRFGFGATRTPAAQPTETAHTSPPTPIGPTEAAPGPSAAPVTASETAPTVASAGPAVEAGGTAATGMTTGATSAPARPGAATSPAQDGAAAVAELKPNPRFAAALAQVEAVEASGIRLAETAKELRKEAQALTREQAKRRTSKDKAVKAAAKAEADVADPRFQEAGKDRDALVVAIGAARTAVDGLDASSLGAEPAKVAAAKGVLHRRLTVAAPYYAQGANANILPDSDTSAAGRTCNVTSISMCLEAMGKGTDDYKGDTGLLGIIAARYTKQLAGAQDVVEEKQLRGYRLPDFLQLVAIAESLEDDEREELAAAGDDTAAADKLIAGASRRAVNNILNSASFFPKIVSNFGATSIDVYPFEDQTVAGGASAYDVLGRVGEINRRAIPMALKEALKKKQEETPAGEAKPKKLTPEEEAEVRAKVVEWFENLGPEAEKKLPPLEAELAQLDAADAQEDADVAAKAAAEPPPPPGKKPKKKRKPPPSKERKARAKQRKIVTAKIRGLKATIAEEATLKESGVNEAALTSEGVEQLLPVEEYKKTIIAAVSPHLDAGKQVISHMRNHYTRLESVSDDHVVIDDPDSAQKNRVLKWEAARALGTFDRFMVISPK